MDIFLDIWKALTWLGEGHLNQNILSIGSALIAQTFLSKKMFDNLWEYKFPKEPTDKDKCSHRHVQGCYGAGKTTFSIQKALEDISRNKTVIFIDPHGTGAKKLFDSIPKKHLDRVVYNKPSVYTLPMNILYTNSSDEKEKNLIVDYALSIIKDMSSHWGDKLEEYITKAIIACVYHEEDFNLLDVINMLINGEFRRNVCATLPNNEICNYVKNFFTYKFKDDEAMTAVRRLEKPLLTPDLFRILSARSNNYLTMTKIMKDKMIYILDLKGLGRRTVNIIFRIHLAEIEKASFTRNEKSPICFVYADEIQRALSDNTKKLSELLEEMRKFRISLTISHHTTDGQLSNDMQKTVWLIPNQYLFRLEGKDADLAVKNLFRNDDTIDAKTLLNLPDYTMIKREKILGYIQKPIKVKNNNISFKINSRKEFNQIKNKSIELFPVIKDKQFKLQNNTVNIEYEVIE